MLVHIWLDSYPGDESMFIEEPGKHRKNDGFWSITNPYLVDETKHQGQKKYMVSVFIGDGCILEPYWFVDSDGKPFTQNSDAYRKMLEEHTIPQMKAKFTLRELRSMWFQQDGLYTQNIYSILIIN